MRKGILPAAFGILLVIIASGCTQQPPIVCDSPYIVKGNNCCLDQNANKVCDSDESGVGGQGSLIKNYTSYVIKMYISQSSPEPDSWSSLPPNPVRHYDGYQIYNYQQDTSLYDAGWLLLYTSYNEEPITCNILEYHDDVLYAEPSAKLTKKGFSGNVSGVAIKALFSKSSAPKVVRYQIICRGDESAIVFQDSYAVTLRLP